VQSVARALPVESETETIEIRAVSLDPAFGITPQIAGVGDSDIPRLTGSVIDQLRAKLGSAEDQKSDQNRYEGITRRIFEVGAHWAVIVLP